MRVKTWTWRRHLWLAMCLPALLTSACGPEGLDFRQDHRLAVVAPDGVPTVHLPLAVRWRFLGPLGEADGPAGFAVFVDRAPLGPGETLSSLDAAERRAVTVTTATEATVSSVDSNASGGAREHQATVVLLDSGGRRIGEASAAVHFYVQESP
jgi:hypothetical protein